MKPETCPCAEVEALRAKVAELEMTIRDLVLGGYDYRPEDRGGWLSRLIARFR